MPEMRDVFSSHVKAIGYDNPTKELHVEYQNGTTAIYEGVPSRTAISVINAPSIGSAIHEHVRNKYPFRYLDS